jgi:hypothetical protein
MFLGRAGVIGYYAHKQKNQKKPQESALCMNSIRK